MNFDWLYLSTTDENAHLLAKQYGLGLEIAEYCTAWNLDEKHAETDALVRKKLAGTPRTILHGPFNELFPCAIDPLARKLAAYRYRQAAEQAKAYGAKKLVIHGGYNPRIYYRQWYIAQSIAFWQEFFQEDPGIPIVLENVLEEEPEMLLEILRGVDREDFRMCLDVGHVNVYSQIPVRQWVKDCVPWLNHFHVHNNDGSWDTHSPLTEGAIPIRELMEDIRTLCPRATVTLELLDGSASVPWLLEGI